jgi:hypothetical protein
MPQHAARGSVRPSRRHPGAWSGEQHQDASAVLRLQQLLHCQLHALEVSKVVQCRHENVASLAVIQSGEKFGEGGGVLEAPVHQDAREDEAFKAGVCRHRAAQNLDLPLGDKRLCPDVAEKRANCCWVAGSETGLGGGPASPTLPVRRRHHLEHRQVVVSQHHLLARPAGAADGTALSEVEVVVEYRDRDFSEPVERGERVRGASGGQRLLPGQCPSLPSLPSGPVWPYSHHTGRNRPNTGREHRRFPDTTRTSGR